MTTEPVEIDVLVVCQHDADMVRRCLTSCKEGAANKVNLFTYVNGTGKEFPDAVDRDVFDVCDTITPHPNLLWNDKNDGFIRPNNELAKRGTAPYLCLLNADTVCAPGWDVPLVNKLTTATEYWEQPTREYPNGRHEQTPPPAIVGYGGGTLGRDGVGIMAGTGADVDYIEGWCLMTTRAVWEALGGFDEAHLTMAYGEDSDLCLRAKERGWSVAAVENAQWTELDTPDGRQRVRMRDHVHHLGGKGATGATRQSPELQQAFAANHAHLRERHRGYLERERVLVKGYSRPTTCARYLPSFEPWNGLPDPGNDYRVVSPDVRIGDFLRCHEIDGRLWQLDFAGQSARFLVP
jgi:hypothetical protein